jgi:hypothetical protein
MDELSPAQQALAHDWDRTELQAQLPPNELEDFCEPVGMMTRQSNCRRSYPRFFVRGKAILRWQGRTLGIYSADASRGGVRFLSPIELVHGARATIRVPNTKEFQIEIIRCQRINDNCYDCGAVFSLGKLT